jgi:hypothetical protein
MTPAAPQQMQQLGQAPQQKPSMKEVAFSVHEKI